MCRKEKFADLAYQQALESNMKFKHGAIITKGSKIVAKGNNIGTRTKILGQIQGCVHAEMSVANKLMNCIIRKKDNKNLSKYTIWVVRINNDKKTSQKYVNSKPCLFCSRKLMKLGFTKIGYSDDNGKIVVDFLRNIDNQIISSTQKCLGKYFK